MKIAAKRCTAKTWVALMVLAATNGLAVAQQSTVTSERVSATTKIVGEDQFLLGTTVLTLRTLRELPNKPTVLIINQTNRALLLSQDGVRFKTLDSGQKSSLSCGDSTPRMTLLIAVDDLGSRFQNAIVPDCGDQLSIRDRAVSLRLTAVGAEAQP